MANIIQMKHRLLLLVLFVAGLATACNHQENKQDEQQQNLEIMENDECLICGAPLEYLPQDTMMECVLCHKKS